MRFMLTLGLAATLLIGCGQAPAGAPAPATVARALAATPATALKALLAQFSTDEGRKVTAKNVPLSDGRGAAELRVPLSQEEAALLVQLYRLHPKRIEASAMPAGWMERAAAHLSALHGFKLPKDPALDAATAKATLVTRCYKDGEGNLLAYESWLTSEHWQMFGKYDLKGKILKVDIETWL